MELLILATVPLAPAVGGGFYWWLKRTRTSFFLFLISTVPVVSFGWLVYLMLGTEAADPSSGEIVLPFMLGGLGSFFLVVAAFQKWPNEQTGS